MSSILDLEIFVRVADSGSISAAARALELTPQTWRWYKDRAPGGPLLDLLAGDALAAGLGGVEIGFRDQLQAEFASPMATMVAQSSSWACAGVISPTAAAWETASAAPSMARSPALAITAPAAKGSRA